MTKAEEMEVLHRLTKSFDSELTEEEEAVLDRLEAEWLDMCRANMLEDFDFWTPKRPVGELAFPSVAEV